MPPTAKEVMNGLDAMSEAISLQKGYRGIVNSARAMIARQDELLRQSMERAEMDEDEPMARVCYDFPSKHWPEIRISGTTEIRTRSQAQKIVETLNAEYGEGSHWVEVLNETYAERHADS